MIEYIPTYTAIITTAKPALQPFYAQLAELPIGARMIVQCGTEGPIYWRSAAYRWALQHGKRVRTSTNRGLVVITRLA